MLRCECYRPSKSHPARSGNPDPKSPKLCKASLAKSDWLGVAQVSNLLYRRFLIGRAPSAPLCRVNWPTPSIFPMHQSPSLSRSTSVAAAIQQFFKQQILLVFAVGGGGNDRGNGRGNPN